MLKTSYSSKGVLKHNISNQKSSIKLMKFPKRAKTKETNYSTNRSQKVKPDKASSLKNTKATTSNVDSVSKYEVMLKQVNLEFQDSIK